MAQVIDFIKERGVRSIFFEELASPKVAEAIAKETGVSVRVLNPLEGLSDEELKAVPQTFPVEWQYLSHATPGRFHKRS